MDAADLKQLASAVAEALIDKQGLSSQQAADIALAAATKAVQENQTRMFALLGVNINDAKDMARFAADIEFLRAMHANAGAVGKRVLMFTVSAFLGALLLAVGAGLKVLLANGAPR